MERSLLIGDAESEEGRRNRVVRALADRKGVLIELASCAAFFTALLVGMSGLAFALTLVPVGGFTDAPPLANSLYASLAYQFPSIVEFLETVPPPPPPLAVSMNLARSPPPLLLRS
jgi:hypothetical protein